MQLRIYYKNNIRLTSSVESVDHAFGSASAEVVVELDILRRYRHEDEEKTEGRAHRR